MKVFKGYVCNHNHSEGCTAECCIIEEAMDFYAEYLHSLQMIGYSHEQIDMPFSLGQINEVDCQLLEQARYYIFCNSSVVTIHQVSNLFAYTLLVYIVLQY